MTEVCMGIDVGTSHCKAGLFTLDGSLLAMAVRRTQTFQDAHGHFYYKPDVIWADILSAITEVTAMHAGVCIKAIGVAGMSETGLFLHAKTGTPLSDCIPWFDTRSLAEEALLREQDNPLERFQKTGLRASFKYGLAKILWLQKQVGEIPPQGVWLSLVDYVTFRLTGVMATDYTLAARTFGFRIDTKTWDEPWLRQFGLTQNVFPEALPAGTVIGRTIHDLEQVGVARDIPVVIGGHDHVCAAYGLGAIDESIIYDSMGTAETLVGTVAEGQLGMAEFESGLAYTPHLVQGKYAWIGGLPSSGGAVDWIRGELFGADASFNDLQMHAANLLAEPSGILFFPYLVGAGAPAPDPQVRAAFIGLARGHGRGDMLKAVLEGTAFEMESIRRAVEQVSHQKVDRVLAVGGGTNFRRWMQIKANVSGCLYEVSPVREATLRGAALIAGLGAGCVALDEGLARLGGADASTYLPDKAQHSTYQEIYEKMYRPMNKALRHLYESAQHER